MGTALGLVLAGLVWLHAQPHLGSQVGIRFMGLTNNSAALLGVSDKVLAVFSVTNRTSSPIEPTSFYYIETATVWRSAGDWSGYWSSYAPLGSGGQIAPHCCGTILTRIPTNGVPWRAVVPYSRTTLPNEFGSAVRDALEDALKRPKYDFNRYGNGAPTSDWVKP
jgi:hypothetical protein